MPESKDALKQVWRNYSGKIAMPTIILAGTCLSLYGLIIYLGINDYWPLWICCLINIFLSYLLFTPMHESVHGNISGRSKNLKSIEKSLGWLCGFSLTIPAPMFRYLHFIHHTHTNDTEKDPDYWVASKNPIYIFFKCATIIGDYYYFYFRDSKKQWQSDKLRKDFVLGILGMVGYYSLFIFWGLNSGWVYPLFLWIVPALVSATFLAFAFDWLPHHPHGIKARYLDTRIVLYPGFTLFLLSQNLHLIHHLYPNVPFYDYPKVFKEIRPLLEEKGANIENWQEAT